jgi:hypothetical protein
VNDLVDVARMAAGEGLCPTAGVDWAKDDHAVAVVDADGRERERRTLPHSAGGIAALVRFLQACGTQEVAIERPDGQVVDALLAAGLTVVVISPRQIKALRTRYGSAGNKDDRFDAYVLGDTLRTDRSRLQPLQPDTEVKRTGFSGGWVLPRSDLLGVVVDGSSSVRTPPAGCCRSWSAAGGC